MCVDIGGIGERIILDASEAFAVTAAVVATVAVVVTSSVKPVDHESILFFC
jgi:hypothetical protein